LGIVETQFIITFSNLSIDDLMLNLQTTSENSPMPDQTENASWLYAGIAAAILVGGGGRFFGQNCGLLFLFRYQ